MSESYQGIRILLERANSRLKEDFGANNVMAKGHSKVTQHFMFGVVVLFADQLLRLLGEIVKGYKHHKTTGDRSNFYSSTLLFLSNGTFCQRLQ
jgi:hypothetical protein